MIFQKNMPDSVEKKVDELAENTNSMASDDVETVVGPSVNVEGDLSSAGDIVVKGSVAGSVHTSQHLTVERGAKIVANVRAGSASISGEVKGNMKIKEALELTASSRILGDVSVKTLTVEPGAVIYGKIIMPGIDAAERKAVRAAKKNKKVILQK